VLGAAGRRAETFLLFVGCFSSRNFQHFYRLCILVDFKHDPEVISAQSIGVFAPLHLLDIQVLAELGKSRKAPYIFS